MTQPDCTHAALMLESHVEELTSPLGVQWLAIRLRIKCSTCNALFSWRGLNSGTPNPDEPVISADGFELRAPIVPGPGGVVGVLQMAGIDLSPPPMEDEP